MQLLYPIENRKSVQIILEDECSKSDMGFENWTTYQMERIWFSVLKLGVNNQKSFHGAVKLAKTDYRDLFMAAGFGEDIHAHDKWWQDISR